MPIYEYQCKKCGLLTEVFQRFSDPPLAKCRQCNGRMKKLISPSTFHLKGTGWYVTDYSSKSGGKEVKKKDKESPAKEAKGSSTSESKDQSSTSAKEGKALS